jgi:DNA-binding helix-hairpin-helix protein with protein kinase domain
MTDRPAALDRLIVRVRQRKCRKCFEHYDRRLRHCPWCHGDPDDFGGIHPPSSPLAK